MKHLNIAICDDDNLQVSLVEKLIEKAAASKFISVDIEAFYDGITLKHHYDQGNRFDIIYLDIEMGGVDGIEAARYIRLIDPEVIIIYISGYDNYYLQLFEVEPFRFIKKPVDEKRFRDVFYKAYEKYIRNPIYFTYKYKKMMHKVLLKDILYFESKGRIVTIVQRQDQNRIFYGKLDSVEKALANTKVPFLRIHKSYYVNFIHIKQMNFSKVILSDDTILSISEERQKYVRERYMEILGEEFND